MKDYVIFFFVMSAFLPRLAVAQSTPVPNLFHYQAVVRDAQQAILPNETVDFKFTILSAPMDCNDPEDATTAHTTEEASLRTNDLGMVNYQLGSAGLLDGIAWSEACYWLKVEARREGQSEYADMGKGRLVSAPYALYAENSGNVYWQRTEGAPGIYYPDRVGIGNTTPSERLVVGDDIGDVTGAQSAIVIGVNNSSRTSKLVFGEDEEHWGGLLWKNSADEVNPNSFHFGNSFISGSLLSILSDGNIGVGTGTPSEKLVVGDDAGNITGAESAIVIGENSSTGISKLIFGEDSDHWGSLYWRNSGSDKPNSFAFQIKNDDSPEEVVTIREDGVMEVKILQINGGDVAEARHSTAGIQLPVGSVVVFDETQKGKIRLTSTPYDKKVAGVISGAGKYFVGVCLLREELSKGAMPVAQIGTVEVLAVGPVQVGSLLVSSKHPGYAMAAKKRRKMTGAVIGKAVTSLQAGERGLVEMQIEKH